MKKGTPQYFDKKSDVKWTFKPFYIAFFIKILKGLFQRHNRSFGMHRQQLITTWMHI